MFGGGSSGGGDDKGGYKGMFDTAKNLDGVKDLMKEVLGPDYSYSSKIKPPEQLGMSADGNFTALGNDIGGLMGYVALMVSGDCASGLGTCASTTGKPLGNKFFLKTPTTCTLKGQTSTSDKDVDRWIYINNVPDGSIPFVSEGMGLRFPSFVGLLPGVMSNISQINPMQILLSFVSGPETECLPITMETIDSEDKHDKDTHYVTKKDIAAMNPAWFVIPGYPKPSDEQLKESTDENDDDEEESFQTLNYSKVDYSRMPDNLLIKFYYSCLGLLGIYILIKMMLKKRR